jgi:digeranylgeranylglycerophospholipid reductase
MLSRTGIMKYDLIVVGGGPAGLMAAKTAAEDGMRVVLVDRKKIISEINRACLQLLYIQKISPLEGGKTYMEPVTVDVGADASRFNFQALGFSLDYQGSLRPYLNWIQVSPSGNRVYRFKLNDRIWGFNYDKESFLATLLRQAEKAGVEILPETAGVGAENTGNGVRVTIRNERSRTLRTLEAKNAIAAEGVISKIVQSLGLDYSRRAISTRFVKGVWYIIEGLESPFPGNSLVSFTIPSFYARNILIGMMPGNRNSITAGTLPYLQIAAHPALAPMLYKARVVKRLSFSNFVRAPLLEPVAGNIIIAGDSAAPTETWMQGAVACGYQAVKAIEKEREGGHGFREFTAWWQQAFSFIRPSYFKVLSDGYALNRVCTDDEIDYVYRLMGDSVGIPAVLIDEKLERVKKDRPELYQKLAGRTDQSMWQKQKEH